MASPPRALRLAASRAHLPKLKEKKSRRLTAAGR
jgi:hypothetical protein